MTNNVSGRAQNIEQSRELNTYVRSRDSHGETRSQRESDWSDNEPIVPREDDEDWQINADSDRVSGQGDDLSNASADAVGNAMSMADDRGLCDDMYVTQISLYINTDLHYLSLSRYSGPNDGNSIVGNKRARSVTPEVQVARVCKAKVSNSKGRLCANDFGKAYGVLINKASGFYRCMISTEDAFPSHIKEMEFAQRAWKEACVSLNATVQPHPGALTVVSTSRCDELLLILLKDYAACLSDAWRGQDQNTPACHH
jgi:hypothetical protein